MMLLLAFLAPLIFGLFISNFLLGKLQLATPVLSSAIAVGVGIGSSSVLFIILNLVHLPSLVIFFIEFALIAYAYWKYKTEIKFNSPAKTGKNVLFYAVAALFIVAIALDIFIFFVDSAKDPHGLYDAWSYWNLRAKFISRAPGEWSHLFKYLYFFHGDYPLLHTGFIARGWIIVGKETVWVPIITAFLFTFATIALLYAAVSHFTASKTQGMIAGLAMLCTPFYMVMGDSQYVDSPAGYFFLIAIVVFALADAQSNKEPYLYILAGLAAGLAAWTKNEGLLFIAVVYGARIITLFFTDRKLLIDELTFFSLGLLPVLALIIYFKLFIAPANDLLAEGNESAIAKLKDMARYAFIRDWFKLKIVDFGKWYSNPWWLLPIYALGVGVNFKAKRRTLFFTASVLLMMLTGYFFIYVTTYIDLTFHLSTSLHRLYFQLMPSFLFLYFVSLKSPEHWLK